MHRVAAVFATLVVAWSAAGAQDKILEQRFGRVNAVCQRDPFLGHPICIVLNTDRVFFGFQFGSEKDPASLSFSVGYHAEPGTGVDVKIDSLPPHSTQDADAFAGVEARAILAEIRTGSRIRVRYHPMSSDDAPYGEFDLADFKTALQRTDSVMARAKRP